MATKVQKFNIEYSGTPNISSVGTTMANNLGCNFDSSLKVLYMGEDKRNGFYITDYVYNVQLYRWVNGEYENNQNIFGLQQSTVYYIKTDNVVVFQMQALNSSFANLFYCGWAKGTNEYGEENWIYFNTYCNGTSSLKYWTEGATESVKTMTGGIVASTNGISLAPIMCEFGNSIITSDYLYYTVWCRSSAINLAFVFDDTEYLILSNSTTTTIPRFTVKLT